jgi:O-methyltransferase involved in polyketide biosynthesis
MSRWDTISITAHYTAQVWVRHGIAGAEAFDTLRGRVLYALAHPLFRAASALGVTAPHEFCLQRHRLIDALVDRLAPGQIIELACGLSPRCLARARATGARCVDVDLADMLELKRRLAGPGWPPGYAQAALDLMAGTDYAVALGPTLRRGLPTVVVAEGLLSYFDLDGQQTIFDRVATLLAACGGGSFLADIHHQEDLDRLGLVVPVFRRALGILTRTTPRPMVKSFEQGRAMLRRAGFTDVIAHRPADWAAPPARLGPARLPGHALTSGVPVERAGRAIEGRPSLLVDGEAPSRAAPGRAGARQSASASSQDATRAGCSCPDLGWKPDFCDTAVMQSLEDVGAGYERFFQLGAPVDQRALAGLHGWLVERFPLRRPDSRLTLEYAGYRLDESPLALETCQELGCDFRRPFWLTLRLTRWSSQGTIEEVLEQEVGLGSMPALTAEGGVFLPELQPARWEEVEAAILEELGEALDHAEQHLCAARLGDGDEPWSILHGGR